MRNTARRTKRDSRLLYEEDSSTDDAKESGLLQETQISIAQKRNASIRFGVLGSDTPMRIFD